MGFLEFIDKKEKINKSSRMLNEAFKEKDFAKAQASIKNILSKEITDQTLLYTGIWDTNVGNDECATALYLTSKGLSFGINWLKTNNSMVPYSVTFFNQKNTSLLLFANTHDTAKASLEINMLGSSIIYYIPIIANVINSGELNLSSDEAVKLGRKVFNQKNECIEWPLYVGAQKYKVFEQLDDNSINERYHLNLGHSYVRTTDGCRWINENELDDKKAEIYGLFKHAKDTGDKESEKMYYKEYRKVLDAIKGGATSINDLECAIKRNVSVTANITGERQAVKAVEEEKSDPKTAFKQMQMYVKMAIKGIQPAVILCGAPGVGKTYRVKQQLKAAGYTMDGTNTIKGKCTPRQLYMTLYDNKSKGDIVLIDDADSLVGPKAPEDCINILKAALDSTADDEGRLVSYKVAGELKDDEGMPIPKYFYTNASIIIITNYGVGQLDSALRNRAFVQSLDFTPKSLLEIVRGIMPSIEPTRLSMASKAKAMDYLEKIVDDGKPIEVSIRSFITCAKLFECAENDEETEMAFTMIEEQMRNMAARGGKHF